VNKFPWQIYDGVNSTRAKAAIDTDLISIYTSPYDTDPYPYLQIYLGENYTIFGVAFSQLQNYSSTVQPSSDLDSYLQVN